MKQVLFVGAGQEFPKGPFAFLQSLQQEERVHARGLFFKPVDYASLTALSAGVGVGALMQLEELEMETVADHKTFFASQCEACHIPYTIHGNNQSWNRDLLIKESRFADLILISSECFYSEAGGRPNQYLREVLHASECPILVIPETFTGVEHLFMAYDGSRESIYAIKQFCALFPRYTDLPTEIVYIKEGSRNSIPDLDNLRQFTRHKFNNMSFSQLNFNAAEYFATWISGKKQVLLVSGSFGRSPISYVTHRSFAEDIIRDHTLPIFIAHP